MIWTEGRKRGFITSLIRQGFRRWPAKYEVLKEAMAGRHLNKLTQRYSIHYKCNICKEIYPLTKVQVDHKVPVVDIKDGFINWDVFIDRLFCSKESLQVLCITCHKKKTLEENIKRKKK